MYVSILICMHICVHMYKDKMKLLCINCLMTSHDLRWKPSIFARSHTVLLSPECLRTLSSPFLSGLSLMQVPAGTPQGWVLGLFSLPACCTPWWVAFISIVLHPILPVTGLRALELAEVKNSETTSQNNHFPLSRWIFSGICHVTEAGEQCGGCTALQI